jgi:hypothetical protein
MGAILFSIWPWTRAASLLVILTLLGVLLVELCLAGPCRIPFSCSYLPGRTNVHLTIFPAFAFITLGVVRGALFLRQAIGDFRQTAAIVLTLAAAAGLVRWWLRRTGLGDELSFDDTTPPALQELGLRRDGAPVFERPAR